VILAAILGLVSAQDLSAASPPPALIVQPYATTVPAGTPLRFVTVATIDSRSAIQGQRVALKLADDLLIGSQLVLARGTMAVGEIDALSQKGMLGKAGKFSLRPLFIDIGGERVNLVGGCEQRGRNGVAAAAVTTALLGGLGLMITGKSAILSADSVVHGEIKADVVIAAPATALPQ